MRHQTVDFGPQSGAFAGVACARCVAAQADLFGEGVKFGGGANETGGTFDQGRKCWVAGGEAGDGELLEVKKINGCSNF